MSFFDLVKERYSVRSFSDKAVADEKLQQILEAGRLAPTAMNEQPQRIFVLKSPSALEKVRSVTPMTYHAPIVLLICYDKNISWKADKFGDDYDAGEMNACIVTTTMMMQATELGVGSLWIRGYCSQDVIHAFDLPQNIVPVCMLALGYPTEGHQPSPMHFARQPLSAMVEEL